MNNINKLYYEFNILYEENKGLELIDLNNSSIGGN